MLELIPEGPQWFMRKFKFDDSTVEYEVRYRNILEAIASLWSNPKLVDHLVYRGRRTRRFKGGPRVYGEMWTGDWWLETEVGICYTKYRSDELR